MPRGPEQLKRYRPMTGILVPEHAVDGRSLLAHADVMIGGGGTMNREAATSVRRRTRCSRAGWRWTPS